MKLVDGVYPPWGQVGDKVMGWNKIQKIKLNDKSSTSRKSFVSNQTTVLKNNEWNRNYMQMFCFFFKTSFLKYYVPSMSARRPQAGIVRRDLRKHIGIVNNNCGPRLRTATDLQSDADSKVWWKQMTLKCAEYFLRYVLFNIQNYFKQFVLSAILHYSSTRFIGHTKLYIY